jgi:hypothetical protein
MAIRWRKREWLISTCVGLLIAALCVALSYVGPEWLGDSAGTIFLPGAFLAAVIFPQGIEGDTPDMFMALAFVFTAAWITPVVFLAHQLAHNWWLGRKQTYLRID